MKGLRAVILAGGSGSRLLPLTRATNKHLLPVGDRPMIVHPLQRIVEAGIRDVLVVTGVEHVGALMDELRSGEAWGARLTYRVQEQPLGIAQALSLARDPGDQRPLLVVLGDNVFNAPLGPPAERYLASAAGAMLLFHRVAHPERFGVPAFEEGRLVRIVEKPEVPPSPYAVTGIYLYDAGVFDIIDTLRPSARGEYEITDVNNRYLAQGRLIWEELPGYWTDAGTHASLAEANRLVREGER